MRIEQKQALTAAAGWVIYTVAIIFITVGSALSEDFAARSSHHDLKIQHPAHWSTLLPSQYIGPDQRILFYKLQTDNGSIANLVVLNAKDEHYHLVPFFNDTPGTTSDAVHRQDGLVGVNGGYFNLNDGQSTSYIVINGKNQCEPKHNRALIENAKLKPYLEQIFNRSELRVLKNSLGKTRIEICKHNAPIPPGWLLESCLQAGPQLLPELTAQEEAFVRTKADGTAADSIGTSRPAARTACGITPDGHFMLLCVASKSQDEFSSGVTLPELAQIFKQLGCNRAINFDGGTSTTMIIRPKKEGTGSNDLGETKQVCGNNPEKLVKSGLIITAAQSP